MYSVAEEHKCITSYQKQKFNKQSLNREQLQPELQTDLLQAVMEGFVDGILILTPHRKILHTNEYARRICRQMRGENFVNAVPEEIWHICQSLIESRELFPGEHIVIESEIETDKALKLRLRVRWLILGKNEQDYLLVILEDRNQTYQSMALSDAKKYGLTHREAEVWLLRQANLSYKEIAERLYITINTVKKHLKNIYAKQQEMLWL
ncbi:hypothetical protein NUACC21_24960 [Scytonema sp. NUACC21]